MSLRLLDRRRPLLLDVVAAAALTAFTLYEVWTNDGVTEPLAAQSACFAVATLSLAARRAAPLLALVVGASALTVQTAALGEAPVVGGFVALLALTYAVAVHAAWRTALVGLAVLAAAVLAEPLTNAENRSVADGVGNAAVFGLLWGVGRLVRRLGRHGAWWEQRAQDLERDREERVRDAVADERQRIARELHDVVAHSVSVMVLQAGAARQYLSLDVERARQPLLLVEDVGREALEELHRLLQVLRRSDDGQRPLAGLDHVDQLVGQVRRAGVDVRIDICGASRRVAPGLDLTAYRVLQEALTNVLRHAPSAHTQVEVVYGERELLLSVVDDGRGAAPRERKAPGGNGLIGMRERVLLYGGRLDVGPREEGGFAVRARLPLVPSVTGP